MTTHDRDKVINAAQKCDAFFDVIAFGRSDGTLFSTIELERFYSIAFEDGRVAEREECAKACEDRLAIHKQNYGGFIGQSSTISEARQCVKAIRERSTK